MDNYTKGDWKVSGSGKRIWVQDIEPNGIHSVTLIAKICDSNEHAPANAQLIASAPKMAKLLEYLVNEGWNAGVTEEAKEILDSLEV